MSLLLLLLLHLRRRCRHACLLLLLLVIGIPDGERYPFLEEDNPHELQRLSAAALLTWSRPRHREDDHPTPWGSEMNVAHRVFALEVLDELRECLL